MINFTGCSLPAFKGKIYVYSTRGNKPRLVKEMSSPKYIDEKGFNGDERRINSLIKTLGNPKSSVESLGKIDIDTCSCSLNLNNTEKVIAQGKKGNRLLSMILHDEPRKQMFKWIVNPDKDISAEVRSNLYKTLQTCLTKLTRPEE